MAQANIVTSCFVLQSGSVQHQFCTAVVNVSYLAPACLLVDAVDVPHFLADADKMFDWEDVVQVRGEQYKSG